MSTDPADPLSAELAAISPPYCRHLMTVEAGPADEMNPDCAEYHFVSRCICGHDIPWGRYQQTMTAMHDHLVSVGLLGRDAPSVTGEDGSDHA
jgi:hypothetical protein